VTSQEPVKNPEGSIKEFMPQSRYRNVGDIPLNRYGAGPFCKFKIPNDRNFCGVYAVVAEDRIKYIGECVNLSSRYNMGYGTISPRNCFVGGQETNCRLNNLILQEASTGAKISLWFLPSDEYKAIEQELRASERPDWNEPSIRGPNGARAGFRT
jgi:hypothetical protein